jgi:hypothetical protein
MDTSLLIASIQARIPELDKLIGQKNKVYQKMLDDLDKIEFVPSKEHFALTLNKNIDIVLTDIRTLTGEKILLNSKLDELTNARAKEIEMAMFRWRDASLNPFGNPRLAGILQNPFLVSPATN